MFRKLTWNRILLILAVVGPGIITSSVDNDAGGITTYSLAGAHFGYALLWTTIPMTVMLILVQEMCARMGVVTGKGLSDLIREVFGLKATFYILVALFFANLGVTMSEFAGVASAFEIFGVSRYISVPIAAFIVWWFITRGTYRFVEKIFLVASLFYITYIISGFLAAPAWGEVAKHTFVPSIDLDIAYLTVLIGMIGTMITPWMQFYLQASVVEKGTRFEDYRYAKWDVILGSILTNVIAFFILIASAAALFRHGIPIETAKDAAIALKPFAGEFAGTLFGLGLLNASLFAAAIVPLSTAYYICEGMGWESGLGKSFKQAGWFKGIYTAMIILGALTILIPKIPLIKIMIYAQVVNGIILIPILIYIVKLVNLRWLMGEHTNRPWYNVLSGITVGTLILLTLYLTGQTLFPNLF